MTSEQGAEKPADVSLSPLVPRKYPELVFALIGPAGTDLKAAFSCLRKALLEVGYDVPREEIRLSKLIERFLDKDFSGFSEDKRIETLMDHGTQLRELWGRGDAVALLGVMEIVRLRKQEFEGKDNKQAYILHSLKHPHEVETLRHIYGKGFFAISVYSPREERVNLLAKRIARSNPLKSAGARAKSEHLIERDELEEGTTLGQDVKDAFPKADLFVDARAKDVLEQNIRRFVAMLFGYPYHTPTKDEYSMYHAKSAAVRSADLGRQVGAAIASQNGDIISVGCNEVPKSGGGLYWEGDQPDGRDFQRGTDATFEQREQMIGEFVGRFSEHEWLAEKFRVADPKDLVRELMSGKYRDVLKNTQVFSLLEFGRSVHAEMAAITDAARRGVSVRGGVLYTTTFPCHLCAKHIVAAGIERVVYIEPYPKSRARDMYDDSIVVDSPKHVRGRVNFEPFVGVSPRQYLEIFEMPEAILRKSNMGKAIEWTKKDSTPRVTRFQNTYLFIEQAIIGTEIDRMRKKVGVNQSLFHIAGESK